MSTDRAAQRRQQRWEDIDSPATDDLLLSGKLAVEGKQRVRRPAQPQSGPGVGDDGPKRAPLSLTGDPSGRWPTGSKPVHRVSEGLTFGPSG